METIPLTDTDRRIVNALARHGRVPYKELAFELGIPTSTCHGRVQALEERGVIRGYSANIDADVLGRSVAALIMMSVQPHQRGRVPELAEELRGLPGVQQVFLIGGEKDLIAHVACESVPALRTFIAEHLGSNPALAQTQTMIVFEQFQGLQPA